MKKMRQIVIDIGSHKLEELRVLFDPGVAEFYILAKWSARFVIKSILSLNISGYRYLVATWRLFFKKRTAHLAGNTKFICIEPNVDICIRPLMKFKRRFDVDFYPIAILGHTHEEEIRLLRLNCYENTLSSSIYNKENLSHTGHLACVAINFSKFLSLLQEDLGISEADEIIMRINCEGAELGVIRALRDANLPVRAIFGSLADVRKIHGEEEYSEMLGILKEMNLNYRYFVGSNPATWLEALGSSELSSLIY